MKKIIAIALALVLVLSFAACSSESDEKTIKVGASPAPHAEILEVAKEVLAKEGYGIAFRKNDIKLRDAVQSTLEEMAKDGTVEAISKKWFGSDITVIGK